MFQLRPHGVFRYDSRESQAIREHGTQTKFYQQHLWLETVKGRDHFGDKKTDLKEIGREGVDWIHLI
jgi:hypothetical protein